MDFLYLCYGKETWKYRFSPQQKNLEDDRAIIQGLGRTSTVQTKLSLHFWKILQGFITVTPCFQKPIYEFK